MKEICHSMTCLDADITLNLQFVYFPKRNLEFPLMIDILVILLNQEYGPIFLIGITKFSTEPLITQPLTFQK